MADTYTKLSAEDKTAISRDIVSELQTSGINLTAESKTEVANQVLSDLTGDIERGEISISISDSDKADIIQEVLAELYARSQDTKTLEKVETLDGITTIPGVRNDADIVSVPLGLLTTNQPIEVSGQDAIDVLVAQGKIISNQLYFTPADED